MQRIFMKRRKFIQQTAAFSAALSAAGMAASFKGTEKSQRQKSTPEDTRPNILFIMTDQLRYDCLGINGNPFIRTPNLDRLAGQSANFSNTYVQSPVCTPSRACFFTGRYAHAHKNRVNYTELNVQEILFPKRLQEAGYQTGIIGKSHLYYNYPPTREEAGRTGFSFVELHDGVRRTDPWSSYVEWRKENDPNENIYYRDYARDVAELDYHPAKNDNPFRSAIDGNYSDTAWTGLRTCSRLKELAGTNQPFFLFSSFWKPHSPYEVPVPYDSMYSDMAIPLPKQTTRQEIGQLPPHLQALILRDEQRGRSAPYALDRETLQWIYRSYYGTVSHIDYEVGRIMQTLDETGLSENTIIIFTSDHGDQLLEHGLFGKNIFYESSIHIPFMISCPEKIKTGRYDQLSMTIDLLPTLFDMIGLEEPYHCQGKSLLPLIGVSGTAYKPRDCVFCENIIPEVFDRTFNFEKDKGIMGIRHPDAKMVRTQKWKYNYYPPGYQELYDLENDPHELENLATDPAYNKVVDEMKQRILNWLITADETDQIAKEWLI